MTRILFICHGNICRSPTAEYIMKDLVRRAGLEDEFEIASAATSTEELGNGVYPPARRMLAAHGIDCAAHRARQMRRDDYARFDLIISMDEENRWNLDRFYAGDPEGKIHNLLDYAGRPGEAVDDPWYTRDFQRAWDDIHAGCVGLLDALTGTVTFDLSACRDRAGLYSVLRGKMAWEDWYGENLDALWDILTEPEHKGKRFRIIPPDEGADADVREYAAKMKNVFRLAGVLAEQEA